MSRLDLKEILSEFFNLRNNLVAISNSIDSIVSTPVLPHHPYSKHFIQALYLRKTLLSMLLALVVLLPVLGMIFIWVSNQELPTFFPFAYAIFTLTCWYVASKVLNNKKEFKTYLFLSRYILRHEKCKHWVHWDISFSTYSTQMYVDQFNNPPDFVLASVNTDLELPPICSKCGAKSHFDKILLNNASNWNY